MEMGGNLLIRPMVFLTQILKRYVKCSIHQPNGENGPSKLAKLCLTTDFCPCQDNAGYFSILYITTERYPLNPKETLPKSECFLHTRHTPKFLT